MSSDCAARGDFKTRVHLNTKNEVVFGEKMSPFFKEVRVSRLFDASILQGMGNG